MLIIHATKKLLNTSRLPVIAYVSKPHEGQLLHSWYATTFSSSFPGKMMTVYIHEPSMLAVICKGKTIKLTWPQFVVRLPAVLERYGFSNSQIKQEMQMADDFVVAKTNSRSMLAYMNQIIYNMEYNCTRFISWEDILVARLEDIVMNSLFSIKGSRSKFFSPKSYWKKVLGDV